MHATVSLRSPLFSGSTWERESLSQSRTCGLRKRTGVAHLARTWNAHPPQHLLKFSVFPILLSSRAKGYGNVALFCLIRWPGGVRHWAHLELNRS